MKSLWPVQTLTAQNHTRPILGLLAADRQEAEGVFGQKERNLLQTICYNLAAKVNLKAK